MVGAGGLGGYLGAVLHRAGARASLVARGATLDALREGGLLVTDDAGERVEAVEAVGSVGELEGADVAFVTTKTYDLDGVAGDVARLAARGTVVVPLLNGVDARARLIEAGVPPVRLAPGVAYLTAFSSSPGRVERQGGHARLILGPANGSGEEETRTLEALARTLEAGGVSARITADVDAELWHKMLVVCCLTAACAITGAPIGPVRDDAEGETLIVEAVREGAAVAGKAGCPLSSTRVEQVLGVIRAFPDTFHPSLIHDLRRGRRTEVEALNGALVRLGRESGVPTPIHAAAACAIRLAESGHRWSSSGP